MEVQDKPEADIVDVAAVVDVVDTDIEVLQILLPTPFWLVPFAFVRTYTNTNFTLQHEDNAV